MITCTDPISVDAPDPVDANTLMITWTTPQSVMDQGVAEYTIAVTSNCLTEDTVTPQQFVVSPLQSLMVRVPNLRK